MKIAARISRIVEPPHRRILKEALSRRSVVMNLSVGDIFIEPHPLVKDAVRKASEESSLTYPPVEGFSELRSLIAEYLVESRSLDVKAENILVTAGASEAFLVALMTVLDPGDRIILPDPTYPQHTLAANLFDSIMIDYYSQDSDVSKQVTGGKDGHSLILVCSPNNPTGRIISTKDMEMLVEHARENGSTIVSDETYLEIFYGGNKPVSPGSFDTGLENTIIIGSFSKNMGITGLRVGFIASEKRMINRASMVRYATSLTSNTLGQRVVLKTLPLINEISGYVRMNVEKRLRMFIQGFKRSDLLKVYEPQGSLYIFPHVPFKSFEFCLELARETGVVMAPGQGFGPSGENHVRISFGAREEDIINSIELLNRFEPKVERCF
ncbi:MAG: pyridoxal phosphate-dependent aminotransferase [Candidatus Brockarchaeota archaeon]|nr:pyridoxal phosphate-dependent aminotransferase [Candidatus Brockarchaeota archaeon]MBO3808473.1 pyridoxal phosphate-dependent aminotransferase [Candidatus Brockarchaeota archaeon]